MPEKKFVGFPDLIHNAEDEPTRPMALDELPREYRIERQMAIISEHHERIARAIRVFWGHKDCVEYLQQLILNGGDGVGRTRTGFKHEVLAAIINLTALHEIRPD